MGNGVGGIEVESISGAGLETMGMEVWVGVEAGWAQDGVINEIIIMMKHSRDEDRWRMDKFYPFVYNLVRRPDSSMDRTKHS